MTDSPPPRPRGAPLGNRNALKHGFYARNFNNHEIKDLQSCSFSGLQDEIDMLRVCMRRTMELYKTSSDPEQSLNLMRVICHLSTCLTRMIRAQHIVAPPLNKTEQVLESMIEEVLQEMGWEGSK